MEEQKQPILVHVTTVPAAMRVLRGQLAHMREQGYRVVAVSSPEPLLEEIGKSQQIETRPLTMAREIAPFRDLISLWQLILLFSKLRPEIVHSHTPKAGMLAMIAAYVTRVPVRVYHIRGLRFVTARGLKKSLLKRCEWLACNLSHRVLCVSRSVREVAIQEGIVKEHRIEVLLKGSHGIDAEKTFNQEKLPPNTRRKIRQQWGIPEKATVIGFVGRLVKDKGIQELWDAWTLIKNEYANAHLLIVGYFEDGDPLPESLQKQLQAEPRIHLTGKQFDIPPLFAAMDIFCLPTYREGLPFVTLEAASMQLPIVATDIPGCVDAIIENETGLLVPVGNATALADGLRQYLTDKKKRIAHGTAGRQRVLQDFRPSEMWMATDSFYRQLMKTSVVEKMAYAGHEQKQIVEQSKAA